MQKKALLLGLLFNLFVIGMWNRANERFIKYEIPKLLRALVLQLYNDDTLRWSSIAS